jgi:hypothetical protein
VVGLWKGVVVGFAGVIVVVFVGCRMMMLVVAGHSRWIFAVEVVVVVVVEKVVAVVSVECRMMMLVVVARSKWTFAVVVEAVEIEVEEFVWVVVAVERPILVYFGFPLWL